MADGTETPLEPAATVIPIRDGTNGIEVLMLRRNSRGAFGGMWVFPGGKVDPEDAAPGAEVDLVDDTDAARRAAVRESVEEAGLAIEPDLLVPFSHWVPPEASPRRFSTWFFLAPAPEMHEVSVDGAEIREHDWLRPADAIARRDAGEIELAPPTWVTLHLLSGAATVQDALDRAAAGEPSRYRTRLGSLDGALVTMWAGDAGYDTGDPTAPGARHRLSMGTGAWVYERD